MEIIRDALTVDGMWTWESKTPMCPVSVGWLVHESLGVDVALASTSGGVVDGLGERLGLGDGKGLGDATKLGEGDAIKPAEAVGLGAEGAWVQPQNKTAMTNKENNVFRMLFLAPFPLDGSNKQ
ncbi:MAG: hypothetical protein WCX64_03195 [Candidatus Micrarchaeia archaeon]